MVELVKGQLQVRITRYIREKVSKRLGTHSLKKLYISNSNFYTLNQSF